MLLASPSPAAAPARFPRLLWSRPLALAAALSLAPCARAQAPFANGQAASVVVGQTSFTAAPEATGAAGLSYPSSVAVSPATGKVYVVDQGNQRVLRYASASAWTSGEAAERVFGQADFDGSASLGGTGVVGPAVFATPVSVAVDGAGRLYVSDYDNHRVLRFDGADTQASNGPDADRVFGQADFASRDDRAGLPAAANRLRRPSGVAVDDAGRLYVADQGSHRVLRFDDAGTQASNGPDADRVFGQADFVSGNGNRGGPRGAGTLYYPTGLAADGAGRLYVADAVNNRVLRFDGAGTQATNGPDADRVFGQADFTGGQGNRGGAPGAGTLFTPFGVAIDGAGRLYVSDYDNHRVLRFDGAGTQAANGPDADGVLGQADFTSSTPATSQTGMNVPTGVAAHAQSNRLLVADQDNSRVLAFDATGALPVELTAFTATASGPASVRLAWTTASESHNAGFTVERRSGTGTGETWQSAAPFTPGRGTTSERSDYAVTVEGLAPGRHAFRLRQTDLDGTSTVAGTVEVSVGGAGRLTLVVASNASSSPLVRVVGVSSEASARVEVFDVLGRVVSRAVVSSEASPLSLDGLSSGVYVVRASAGGRVATAPLVVR